MARINSTYNIKSKELTSAFPKWSAAYGDPNSSTNRVVNPFANAMDYMSDTTHEILKDSKIVTTDPDKHPYKQWIFNYQDVISYDTDEFDTADIYIDSITDVDGIISGVTLPLNRATNQPEYYEPENPTAWFVSGEIYHSISGEIATCSMINSELYVTVPSGETYDPGRLITLQLPNRWFGNPRLNETLTTLSDIEDPNYTDIDLQIITTYEDQRVQLEHQLNNRSDKITIIDYDNFRKTGIETEVLSGFTLIDTNGYIVRDNALFDLDEDGIVDQRELDIINKNLGKSKSDFSSADWVSTYSRYDINGDRVIDERDKEILIKYQNTISRDVSVIQFDNPGVYSIRYSVPNNNSCALTSVVGVKQIEDESFNIEYFRNTKYGYLSSFWPDGYIDATFDWHRQIYYYLDNASKSVWAYQTNILGNTYDNMKIVIPVVVDSMELKGICYSNYRIYILGILDGSAKIIIIRTDFDNPDDNIIVTSVHSGALSSSDNDIIIRDAAGLSENVKGLTVINDSKLLTFEGNKIKILLPIYDYYLINDDDNGNATLHMREKYEEIQLSPSGEVVPIYRNIFNQLDQHAQDKGIVRLPGETNVSLKNRTMDVFRHFPSRDRRGSLFGIQRELGLPIADIGPEDLNILPGSLVRDYAGTMKLFISGEPLTIDDIEIDEVYHYGKHTHDQITYYVSGEPLVKIDKDIIL